MSKNKTFLNCIYLLSAAITLFSCNKVIMTDVMNDASVNEFATPPDTVFVQNSCNTTNRQIKTFDYNFPKPNYTCEWEKNGNLRTRDRYFQARIEQMRELVLGANTILCDVKFKFATQEFLYDDHFLFTFNDAVIASSYDFSSKLDRQYGLLRYDWPKLAGMFWDDKKEGVYCASDGNCSFPKHDVGGTIKMSYSSIVFQKLMAENLNRNVHQLKFITLGDNDEYDCEHSNIDFSLEVEYVNKTSN